MVKRFKIFWVELLILSLGFSIVSLPIYAATLSQSSSIGLQGTIPSNPPSSAATITTPVNGTSTTTSPISINGLCVSGLLIKVIDNGVFVGSVICTNGSYSLEISLFNGQNQIVVEDFDALNQSGPNSQTITVNYVSAQFSQSGIPLSLTSPYAEKGAEPGSQLQWPIVLNGGTAPYALSVDWGDGSQQQLFSEVAPGTIYINHTYNFSGVYTVIIRATDKNGETSYLQLVGQATGQVKASTSSGVNQSTKTKVVIWWPVVALIPLIFLSFWIGGKYRLEKLRRDIVKGEEDS